ncbi:hypothetical protein SAMN05444851_1451 [Aliiroseovarius sediminilitoris]|uniref:Dihydroorotate dehydrogenase n=1 Tax=Aliiroseovarius sediminilitoris TaxID=1173584 RepID=A0A1I0P918_9RHOB|nr:dihydroorotate dehydrogenase [Aliiroseovarius sediminilitoris]SEW10852.1 hypothetical protein SAMN05444851_1451 [Aliiroseovarius sediminilitoris]
MAKTDKNMLDDHELEAFFDAARFDPTTPSEALMAAILDDAATEQAGRDTPAPSLTDIPTVKESGGRRAGGFWTDLKASLGGWPALAGMATATVAGVWIGFAAPTQLEVMSGGLVLSGDYAETEETYALEDLAPGYLGTGVLMEDEG